MMANPFLGSNRVESIDLMYVALDDQPIPEKNYLINAALAGLIDRDEIPEKHLVKTLNRLMLAVDGGWMPADYLGDIQSALTLQRFLQGSHITICNLQEALADRGGTYTSVRILDDLPRLTIRLMLGRLKSKKGVRNGDWVFDASA